MNWGPCFSGGTWVSHMVHQKPCWRSPSSHLSVVVLGEDVLEAWTVYTLGYYDILKRPAFHGRVAMVSYDDVVLQPKRARKSKLYKHTPRTLLT